MKAGLFTLAASAALLELAAAQPRHAHQHQHKEREPAVVYDYDTVVVTATAPDVVVYVDANGNPVSTSYVNGKAAATPAPVVVASAPVVEQYTAPAPKPSVPAYSPPAPPAYTPVSSSSPPASSSAPPSSGGEDSLGLVYTAYSNSGGCKSQDQVNSDFEKIAGQGYNLIRIYGTDCDQVTNVGSAAKAHGMKVFAGVYDITQVSQEIGIITSAMSAGIDNIEVVSIGNELVNSGKAAPGDVVAAIGTARALLKAAGYTGKVVTVDTFVALIAHPELCKASDFAAANAHAFFDGGILAAGAGAWTLGQQQAVSAACGGQDTWITEAGWPNQGNANKLAVPSPENQKAAISSLRSSFGSKLIVFTAFNDMWKQDSAATFGCEKYWGIYGTSS